MRVPVFLTLVWVTSAHVDAASDRDLLRGIPGVNVIIEDLSPELQSDGLTKDQLRTDIELKLRSAHIPIVSSDDSVNGGAAMMDVSITSIRDGARYACFISLNVDYPVGTIADWSQITLTAAKSVLPSDKAVDVEVRWLKAFADLRSRFGPASIWDKGVLLTGVERQRAASRIRDRIKDFVDSFLNDWLAANEVPSSAQPSK